MSYKGENKAQIDPKCGRYCAFHNGKLAESTRNKINCDKIYIHTHNTHARMHTYFK